MRVCPSCSHVWHSSGWKQPVRLRCECGAPLNLAEAQLDRELIDECKVVADDLKAFLEDRKVS